MILVKRKDFAILRKIYPFIVAVITCAIGYSCIYYYAHNIGQTFTNETSSRVVSRLDNLFISLHATNSSVMPLMDIDCKTIQPILEKIVSKDTKIKSITLMKEGQLHCSSDKTPTKTKLVTDPKLLLQLHNPNTALIFLENELLIGHTTNTKLDHRVIITVVSYQVLQDILMPRVPTQLITLNLHGHIISYQGIDETPIPLYHAAEAKSFNDFDYNIKVGYIKPLDLEIISYYHGIGLLLVTLLAFLLYFLTRWSINNIATDYYELNTAINNNQIKAYLQPVLSAIDDKLMGVEVLCRWHHPKLGIISPNTFIPFAEKTGLIIPLTQHLMNEVSLALAPYSQRIQSNFHIGFNISREHCKNLQLIDDCKQFYKQISNNNVALVIEITERELIEVTETTKQLFRALHTMNIKIALDDFGVGNSNISYLYDFAIDYLKIDKSFISRIGSDALSKNILDAIIEIAQSCKLESCAEGVETEEQATYLKNKKVTYLQGYFFSPPLPLKDFIASNYFLNHLN